MGLTGLDIYKNLPKENCKECGLPTCLAFAMKVAAGQAGLDLCPRLDDSARSSLDEASAPPQQLVKIGVGDKAVEIGQQTVLYRHEERFHHPTAVAVCLNDNLDGAAIQERCRQIAALKFERVGKLLEVDLNDERYRVSAFPILFGASLPMEEGVRPPSLGEHTEEYLGEVSDRPAS